MVCCELCRLDGLWLKHVEQIKSKGDCLKELVGKQNINQDVYEIVCVFCMMALFLHIHPAIKSGHLKVDPGRIIKPKHF